MKISIIIRVIVCLLFLFPLNAYAYLGPGLGVGTIGAILGVLGSILLAIFAVLYYPIKRLFKKIKKPQNKDKSVVTEKGVGSSDQDSGDLE